MPARRKKKEGPKEVGLSAREVAGAPVPGEVQELMTRVAAMGGVVLAPYREPFGGHWVLIAALPIDQVEPTPYQRELSETHVARLGSVIEKVGRFLDPVIAVPQEKGFWSPNGMHRLVALRRLGAKAIVALIVPEPEVAFRILALNTEKAHALRDKSLEVIRMARALSSAEGSSRRPESDWAFEFEEPSYLTLGLCYEERPRFSGGVYLPVLRRCEEFLDKPIARSLGDRTTRARLLLELDDEVMRIVARLKEAGLKSAYLKPFVVARVNPLRFVKAARPGQKAPRAALEATLGKMLEAARKFDVRKVQPEDLASLAAGPVIEE
jgi:ParB family chromosome partitioning protein